MGVFKVIFLGLTVAGPEEEARLLGGLQKKFNLTPERAERLLQKVPVVVKKGISKEEMEKYVKAFGEIGGRTRVEEEEEMITEMPEIHSQPEPGKKPYMERMVTCPQCGFEQPETNECVKCGVVISRYSFQKEPAQPGKGKIEEVSPEERYIPWESGEGFISAFFKTTRDALFSSTRFFKKVGSGEGYLPALIYGLICGIVGFGGFLICTTAVNIGARLVAHNGAEEIVRLEKGGAAFLPISAVISNTAPRCRPNCGCGWPVAWRAHCSMR